MHRARTRRAATRQARLDGDDHRRRASPGTRPDDAAGRRRPPDGTHATDAVRVAVLAGGRSSEHDVSLASRRLGARRARGRRPRGRRRSSSAATARGATTARSWTCAPGRGLLGADVVFPVLHGPFGEDGTVQGLLELLDVPYVGSGVLASAVCMDKVVFKDLMAQAGPAAGRLRALRGGARRRTRTPAVERSGSPCWVKPARLGSSVGIARVAGARRSSRRALEAAFAHDPRVIVEASAPRASRSSARCSATPPRRARASRARSSCCAGPAGTTTRPSTTPGGMELRVPARISASARATGCGSWREPRSRRPAAAAWRAPTSSSTATTCCSTSSTRCRASPQTSVYGKLWAASGLPYPELVDRLVRRWRSSATPPSARYRLLKEPDLGDRRRAPRSGGSFVIHTR